jgi:hypothetical protein
LSTAATARGSGKKITAFFTFYDFLSVKNMIWAKKLFKMFGVKPKLSIYSLYHESKKTMQAYMQDLFNFLLATYGIWG